MEAEKRGSSILPNQERSEQGQGPRGAQEKNGEPSFSPKSVRCVGRKWKFLGGGRKQTVV